MSHTVLTALLLLPALQAPTATDSAEARRSAVETLVTPEPWVAGHEFSIEARMRELRVPGVSVAVIHEGRIDWAAGYGVRDAATQEPVTTETLFQAASISKPVSALVTLSLAQEGRLDIDAPVNDLLTSWQLPDDGFEGAVTPRMILSHTAGLGVHGFPGYATFDPLPTAVEVLDGAGVANTGPVRRIDPLGQGVRYSGGGSTVLQVALTDLMGVDFATLASKQVLTPLGMERSTFAQPLDVGRWPDHAAAHSRGGHVVPGRFHIYPEQFPAGLWTTPSDIARFALELQGGEGGNPRRVLDAEWAEQMVTAVREASALGVFLEQAGGEVWFQHSGANEGFRCLFRASLEGGRGVVVMTNSDRGIGVANEIVRAVARVYDWPGVVEDALAGAELEPEALALYTGRYAFAPDEVVIVTADDAGLHLHNPPDPARRMVPLGEHRFLLLGTRFTISFAPGGAGGMASLALVGQAPRANRLGEFDRWPIEDLLDRELESALAFYRDVHGANPADPMVERNRLRELAAGLFNDDHREAGLAVAGLLVELYPGDARAWQTLGQLRAQHGDREAASQAYRKCLELVDEDAHLDGGERAWLRANSESMLRGLKG